MVGLLLGSGTSRTGTTMRMCGEEIRWDTHATQPIVSLGAIKNEVKPTFVPGYVLLMTFCSSHDVFYMQTITYLILTTCSSIILWMSLHHQFHIAINFVCYAKFSTIFY